MGGRTHSVGEKRAPNAFGLHAVHGNLMEWCADKYHDTHDPALWERYKDEWDMRFSSGSGHRVCRGGNYCYPADYTHSAFRVGYHSSSRSSTTGFRLS